MTEARPITAALCVLLAMAVMGFIDNFVVIIAEHAGLWQFHLMRAMIALPGIALLSFLGLGTLRPVRLRNVLIRNALFSTSMVLYFGALALLPIAEVVAGIFTAPFWIISISALFLGQRVGAVRILAAAIGFAGVLMVLKPDAGGLTAVTALPLAGGLLYGLSALATRELCSAESALTLNAFFFAFLAFWGALGLLCLAVLAPEAPPGPDGFIIRGWVEPNETFLFWTVVQAIGAIFAIGFLTRGYQMAEASFVSVFEYSLLGFVAFWAFVLWGEGLDPVGAIGIALIAISGAVIALRGQ